MSVGPESEGRAPTQPEAAQRGATRGDAERGQRRDDRPGVMLPNRRKRLPGETLLMRLVATAGVVGIGVAIAAIMRSQHSEGWVIGLVVSLESVILAAFLWSTRRL